MKKSATLNKQAVNAVRSCLAIICLDEVYPGRWSEDQKAVIKRARDQFMGHILSVFPQAAK